MEHRDTSMRQDSRSNKRGLSRLAADTRGNTLALMATAMIPAAAFAGSAIDAARMYVVKVRLQQACDAGVLAGRKFMTSSTATTLDTKATTQARAFFNNNFKEGWMQTAQVSFTPTKTADQQVAGAASARVPMAVMKMFNAPDITLNVVCEARFDVADADVMFVLDTTGSMACAANQSSCSNGTVEYTREDGGGTDFATVEGGNAKIKGLRQAVLNFYDTMVANADPTTHIRYGFVAYASSTNVGRILPTGTLHTGPYGYASRKLDGDANDGDAYGVTLSGYNSGTCATANRRYPGDDATVREGWYTNSTAYRISGAAWSSNACRATRQNLKPRWRYTTVNLDTTAYVAGNDVVDPTKLTGALVRKWRGCIEERETEALSSFDINDLPPDLDPDLVPNSIETRWKPAFADVIYQRDTGRNDEVTTANRTNNGDETRLRNGNAPCGKRAQRLGPMTRSEVETYLSPSGDFRPHGGTYHDVGMIWGTRLISPTGLFKDDTAAWPGRNAPNRHIIFMTDGDMAPTLTSYGLYSIEQSERRVTGNNTGTQLARHNARFVAECRAARARNIEVWVIAFGTSLNQQLRDCATQDNAHVFFAADDDALDEAFTKIAKQIAMLRVSK
jgi:Flp pilus assembly protein TadG